MHLLHLASRLFGVPLMIERQKLDVIMGAIGARVGALADEPASDDGAKLYGPGDSGRSRKSYYVTEDGIGVIDVIGPLVKRASGDFISGGPTTYGEIETEFMDAVTDPNIRGVLLMVDSPGGESVGMFELADLIHSQRAEKPIFAVADGDAFSAAYALASSAERLYVTRSGGVGSIGVWMMHVDQSAYNAKVGIKPTYLFAGKRKVDGNPHEPLSDEARDSFQSEVDRTYEMFVETVARNRGLSAAAVRSTEASLFFGENGVTAGLADEVGTVSDALAALRSRISGGSSSRAATTAASKIQKREVSMKTEDTTGAAVEENPPADQAGQEEPQGGDPEAGAISLEAATLTYAVDVTEYCVLAGMPGRIAGFLRARTSVEDVRRELVTARADAANDAGISSQILPESGTETARPGSSAKTKTEDSPLVRAAEKLAGNMGKEK